MKHIIILTTLLILASCTIQPTYDFNTICTEQTCFDVKIPMTDELMQKGLMYVEEMDDSEGMLFVFQEPAIHSFWMKNTKIPLDIIWLAENLTVIHIENAKPCIEDPCRVYTPKNNSLYVLEINQGLAQTHNITEGSVFHFS